MENFPSEAVPGKIVPLTRKKLLAQALIKDSPVRFPLKNRKFSKHSASFSLHSLENTLKPSTLTSLLSSPLQEKDINKQPSILKKQLQPPKPETKPKSADFDSLSLQTFLIKLWKCHKLNLEIDNLLRFEIERFLYELQFYEEYHKIVSMLAELKSHIMKQDDFPNYVFPYLEEVLSTLPLVYPLVVPGLALADAEAMLAISVCRMNTKRLRVRLT
jgi:hypothetical protein